MMTDKEQIMINGVDVSGCEYLTYELEEDGKYYWFCNIAPAGGPDECECNPECFYKKIFRQLARKTQECEKLKEELKFLKNNEDLLISNLQLLWGKQIAEEQGDCKNIDYSKPRTKEIYHKITEIDRTLKDVAFAQSIMLGKTQPLGDTGSPRSYKRWKARERKSLEREFLK